MSPGHAFRIEFSYQEKEKSWRRNGSWIVVASDLYEAMTHAIEHAANNGYKDFKIWQATHLGDVV